MTVGTVNISLADSLSAMSGALFGEPVPAQISRIATGPEFTPPVIYSNAQRAKLVFLVEARPRAADSARLHPGQPLDVKRMPKAPA